MSSNPARIGPDEWRRESPSTLDAIEALCDDFRLWHACARASPNLFSAELLLREALTNSVLHGSSGDPHKRIVCAARAKPGRLVIAVRDQGQGFDWRKVLHRLPEVSETNGRGVAILRCYASLVRFNRKGNSVTLVKRFQEPEASDFKGHRQTVLREKAYEGSNGNAGRYQSRSD